MGNLIKWSLGQTLKFEFGQFLKLKFVFVQNHSAFQMLCLAPLVLYLS